MQLLTRLFREVGTAAKAHEPRRRKERLLSAERLEDKRLLAVDIVTPIANQSLATLGQSIQIDLGSAFRLGDTLGSVVKVETNAPGSQPSLYVELFDTLGAGRTRTTPVTAQNFLGYVNDGSFNRSIIHRSVGGLIQSGGYTAPVGNAVLPDQSPNPDGYPLPISSKGSIADEIGNPNLRGTIAMAKALNSSQLPIAGSATSQWFVNVVDNRDLDSQYAAFGRVLGDGMAVIDVLASVPPFEADTYYDDPFQHLPLWQFPSDRNVRPENFLTFTRMSRVAADDLLGFTATSSDAGLVQAALVGDTLSLSRVGASAGTATIRVRASSVFDATDFRDYEFTVTVPELPRTTIENISGVTLAYDAAGRIFANGTIVQLGGVPIDYNAKNAEGWQAVAADAVGGVNTLVWRHTSGHLHFWRFSNTWAQLSSDGWQSPGSSEFYTSETTFGIDFNGDETIGVPLTVLETTGSVTLAHDPAGRLHANGTMLTLGGNPVDYNAMNAAGWRAVAAEAVGGVNSLVWRHASGNLHFWRFSDSWAQQGGDGWHAPGSSEFNSAEVTLNMDFNDDGVIGAALTTIESVGAVRLAHDTAGSLFADSTRITLSGGPVDYRGYDALGWKAMAAERIGGVNSLVWRHASGNLHFWRFSDSWAQQGGDGWHAPGSSEFNTAEVTLNMDFNDDGVIGAALTPIESVGGVTLAYDRAGRLFAGSTMIALGGNAVDFNAMNAAGWRAVAAEAVEGVNSLVWRHASGNLHFWRLSSSWALQSSDGWQAPGSSEFYASERAFGTDFNNDSVIGGPLTVIENVGAVRLGYDDAGHLFANATKVSLGGNPVDFHAMNAAGWRAVAAEAIDGVNTLVWRHASRALHFWRLSNSWAQESADGWQTPRMPEAGATEVAFGIDLNGNGTIGQ